MASVELIPLVNEIRYRICGKVWCDRMDQEIPNSRTLDKSDLVWINVFGSKTGVDEFLGENKITRKTLLLADLLYDPCDRIIQSEREKTE